MTMKLYEYLKSIFMRVEKVRSLAAMHQGTCTWPVSQCFDPIASVIKKSTRTTNGICEIFAAKWMADALNSRREGGNTIQFPGTDDMPTKEVVNASLQAGGFKNWLGATQEAIDPAKVALLGQIHGTVNLTDGTGRDAWLLQNGIHKQKMQNGGQYRDVGGHAGMDPSEIIRTVAERTKNFNPVGALVNIDGRQYFYPHAPQAHALAIYIKRETTEPHDIQFFDPNYGEFTFTSAKKLQSFMVDFWRVTGYASVYTTGYSVEYVGADDIGKFGAGIKQFIGAPIL